MRTFLLIFFSLISIRSVALSGYEEAVDFAKKKDYKQSIAEFIKVAKESDDEELKSKSMFNVAVMYENGMGVPRNPSLALIWYQSSAEKNNKIAQYNLGWMYYHGDSVEKDYFRALRYYEQSANQGYVKAQFNLANLYFSGLGTKKDFVQAYKWFKICSSGGVEESRQYLNFLSTQISAEELVMAEQLVDNWMKEFRTK